MPNWCENAIVVTGSKEQVEKFINHVKSEDSDFDFNNVIKMPDNLVVECSNIAKQAYALYYGNETAQYQEFYADTAEELKEKIENFEKNYPNAKYLADSYHQNQTQFGYTNWYDWCNAVWGTKWNPSEVHKGEFVKVAGQELYQIDYYFQTAWSYPEGIYQAIAKLFPNIVVSVDVDEEGGYFWGNILIKDGELIEDLQEGVRPGGPYDYGDEEDEE